MSTATLPKLAYSKAQAAEACGVSPKTIERATKKRALLGKRTGENGGGPYLYLRDDLQAWLDSLEDA